MCAEHCWGWTRTPSGRALLPDLRETAKAELQSVESIEEKDGNFVSSDWNFVMFNEVQPSNCLIPWYLHKCHSSLLSGASPKVQAPFWLLRNGWVQSAFQMSMFRLFDLKQVTQAKQLGTAQRPAPQGAEVRSVRFWKKNVRSFSVFFFWCNAQSNADAKQVESWGSRGRDHVVNVK